MLNELGLSEIAAELNSSDFPELHEKLEGPMRKWLEDRTVEDVEVDGVSLKEAMEVPGSNFIFAIQGLNDLLTGTLSDDERKALVYHLKNPMIRA